MEKTRERLTCGMCGKTIDEPEITFIEVDWGLCEDCLKEANGDIEKEMEKLGTKQ